MGFVIFDYFELQRDFTDAETTAENASGAADFWTSQTCRLALIAEAVKKTKKQKQRDFTDASWRQLGSRYQKKLQNPIFLCPFLGALYSTFGAKSKFYAVFWCQL